jgi:hypothetical protein
MVERIDHRRTAINGITAKTPEGARIPITVDTDEEALWIALACCLRVTPPTARVVRIRDTKHLELLYVSAAALSAVLSTGHCEVIEPLHPMRFDDRGMFFEGWPAGGA